MAPGSDCSRRCSRGRHAANPTAGSAERTALPAALEFAYRAAKLPRAKTTIRKNRTFLFLSSRMSAYGTWHDHSTFATRCLMYCVLLALLMIADQDYYISLPGVKGIQRLDAVTNQLSPFVSGPQFPFYGEWDGQGNLYVPDTTLQTVWRVDMGGHLTRFATGGLLSSPATVAIAPTGDIIVSNLFVNQLIAIDVNGQQSIYADNTAGLFAGPGGMAFAPDGLLYVANHYGNSVVVVHPDGQVFPFSDGQGMLKRPAGLQVDGSGNVFVVNYRDQYVVRIPIDTGLAETFTQDVLLDGGNDLKLSRRGRLLVTVEHLSSLLSIDPLGTASTIKQDFSVGPWEGVAVPEDFPHCAGRMLPYGQGTPGTGGLTPQLRGIFSPCLGAKVALDI